MGGCNPCPNYFPLISKIFPPTKSPFCGEENNPQLHRGISSTIALASLSFQNHQNTTLDIIISTKIRAADVPCNVFDAFQTIDAASNRASNPF